MTELEFKQKYQQYSEELYRICYGYTHNKADAEDLLQEVFLKYLKKSISFQDPCEEKYWLIRVAINTCKNYAKSAYHTRVTFSQELIDVYPDQQRKKEVEVLKNIVMHLPHQEKEIIVLYYYNSYRSDEIASALKISVQAVRKRLERARKKLLVQLEEYL